MYLNALLLAYDRLDELRLTKAWIEDVEFTVLSEVRSANYSLSAVRRAQRRCHSQYGT